MYQCTEWQHTHPLGTKQAFLRGRSIRSTIHPETARSSGARSKRSMHACVSHLADHSMRYDVTLQDSHLHEDSRSKIAARCTRGALCDNSRRRDSALRHRLGKCQCSRCGGTTSQTDGGQYCILRHEWDGWCREYPLGLANVGSSRKTESRYCLGIARPASCALILDAFWDGCTKRRPHHWTPRGTQ